MSVPLAVISQDRGGSVPSAVPCPASAADQNHCPSELDSPETNPIRAKACEFDHVSSIRGDHDREEVGRGPDYLRSCGDEVAVDVGLVVSMEQNAVRHDDRAVAGTSGGRDEVELQGVVPHPDRRPELIGRPARRRKPKPIARLVRKRLMRRPSWMSRPTGRGGGRMKRRHRKLAGRGSLNSAGGITAKGGRKGRPTQPNGVGLYPNPAKRGGTLPEPSQTGRDSTRTQPNGVGLYPNSTKRGGILPEPNQTGRDSTRTQPNGAGFYLNPTKRGGTLPEPSQTGRDSTRTQPNGVGLYPNSTKRGGIYPNPAKRGGIYPNPAKRGGILPEPNQTGWDSTRIQPNGVGSTRTQPNGVGFVTLRYTMIHYGTQPHTPMYNGTIWTILRAQIDVLCVHVSRLDRARRPCLRDWITRTPA